MANWGDYLNDTVEENTSEVPVSNPADIPVENNTNTDSVLSKEELAEYLKRFCGRDIDGNSKVTISYQTYAIEDENQTERERIYTTSQAAVEISTDALVPGFFTVDIKFRSYSDPELKMLWARLQKFKNNEATQNDKTWIFYFNLLERASITQQTLENDNLLIAHMFNPLVFYLTRETPEFLTDDRQQANGELYGGNIIRMLVSTELLSFEIVSDIDTSEIKGEVQRELEESRYIDSENASNKWSDIL